MGAFLVGLHEHLLQRRTDHRLVCTADAAQHVAHEVDPAALPAGGEHLPIAAFRLSRKVSQDAVYPCFLDNRVERLLRQSVGLQEGREVRPLKQLRNTQVHSVPSWRGLTVTIAVVVGFALIAALVGSALMC